MSLNSAPSPESEYHPDPYGRLTHYSLFELACRIDASARENGGKYSPFPVSADRWARLERENAYFNGGTSICDGDFEKVNFIWRGVPVYPVDSDKIW
ncbi:MAG TPA: hypothetical protein VG892_07615 [Terriglobales bacterium]|nr:hypothetical protein [Terriglobales bacterium]